MRRHTTGRMDIGKQAEGLGGCLKQGKQLAGLPGGKGQVLTRRLGAGSTVESEVVGLEAERQYKVGRGRQEIGSRGG